MDFIELCLYFYDHKEYIDEIISLFFCRDKCEHRELNDDVNKYFIKEKSNR